MKKREIGRLHLPISDFMNEIADHEINGVIFENSLQYIFCLGELTRLTPENPSAILINISKICLSSTFNYVNFVNDPGQTGNNTAFYQLSGNMEFSYHSNNFIDNFIVEKSSQWIKNSPLYMNEILNQESDLNALINNHEYSSIFEKSREFRIDFLDFELN